MPSLPVEDENSTTATLPSTKSATKASSRSSFSALTGRGNSANERSTTAENNEKNCPNIKLATETQFPRKQSIPSISAAETIQPTYRLEQVSVPAHSTIVEGGEAVESFTTIKIEEPENDTPSVWDSAVPYVWIINYVLHFVILSVMLFFADTRLIGVAAFVVSLLRRFFYYFA